MSTTNWARRLGLNTFRKRLLAMLAGCAILIFGALQLSHYLESRPRKASPAPEVASNDLEIQQLREKADQLKIDVQKLLQPKPVIPFHSPAGGFSVAAPVRLDPEAPEVLNLPAGRAALQSYTGIDEQDGTEYAVGFARFPQGSVLTVEGAIEGAAGSGVIRSKTNVRVGGYPGLEANIVRTQQGTRIELIVRCVIIGDRILEFMVIAHRGGINQTQAHNFFESVRIE